MKDKPKGLIRYVLLVVSHSVEPTPSQSFEFLNDILPELKSQHDGTEKLATKWVTKPMASIDMTALAIETFGAEVMNNTLYVYRTIHVKLGEGDAKCLVAYDKMSAIPTKQAATAKQWWQFWRQN